MRIRSEQKGRLQTIELGATKRESIVDFCKDNRISLVRAAAEGRGWVFVSTLDSPSFCLILTGGFSYLVGMSPHGEASINLYHLLARECGETSILTEDRLWDNWVERRFASASRTVSRYLLRAPEGMKAETLQQRTKLDETYQLRPLAIRLLGRLREFSLSENLMSSFASQEAFETYGRDYVVLKDNEPISACLVYVYSEEIMDVKTATEKVFRRRGLASTAGVSLLLSFRESERLPDWDTDSLFSTSLDERLGYHAEHEYRVYQIAVE